MKLIVVIIKSIFRIYLICNLRLFILIEQKKFHGGVTMLVDVKKKKVLKERLLTPEDALSFIKDNYIKKKLIKKGYKK